MKCSDVSNPTKVWPLYSQWIDRIISEFTAQGDKEKEQGLPISPFCNRDNANNIPLSQKSFINFIVAPLFDAMHSWVPLEVIMDGLNESMLRFCTESDGVIVNAGRRSSHTKT
jgi:hypothetical protein